MLKMNVEIMINKLILIYQFIHVFSFVCTPENSSLSPLYSDKFIVFSFVCTPENSSLSPLYSDKFIVFSFVCTPENSSLSPLRFDQFIHVFTFTPRVFPGINRAI